MKRILSHHSPQGDSAARQEHRYWQRLCQAEPELRTLEQAIRLARPPAAPLGFFVSWRVWKRVLAGFAGPAAKVPALRDPKAERFVRAFVWLRLDASRPMAPAGRKCA